MNLVSLRGLRMRLALPALLITAAAIIPAGAALGLRIPIIACCVLAAWLAMAAVIRMATRSTLQSIRELTSAIENLAAGQWNRRIHANRGDELSPLASAFNTMAEQLERAYRDVQQEVARQTSQLRQSNEELQQAKSEAERRSRAKGEFLAHTSHEIRNPMTALLGFSDMLIEGGGSEQDRQQWLQSISRNARHLSELVNNVLDLSKIEAGQMTVEKIPCDLPELIDQIAMLTRPQVVEKGVEFVVRFETPAPRQIRTDPLRMRQILVNLIGNACKFTEKGTIELIIGCDAATEPGGDCTIRCTVADSGVGMLPAQLAKLFKPFTQAEDSTCRRFGGTGLGLTISKSLAMLLGGDITVCSQPGAGTQFTLTLNGGPIDGIATVTSAVEHETATPAAEKSAPIQLRGRILLAEDGRDNQNLISLHLRRAGAQVTVVDNGRVAVERLQSKSFDVVLMDVEMPELDGCSATRLLRQRGVKVPIIALTARAMSGDRNECLQAGCDEYLPKPIDKMKLLLTVARFLTGKEAAGLDVLPAKQTDPQPTRDERITSELANDPDLKDLLMKFVGLLPGKVRELSDLLAAHDLEALRQFAHQIKGSAGGYGFPDVTVKAAQLEAQLHANTSFDAIAASASDLVALIRRIDGYEPPREKPARRDVAA
jgi:signal transduction histidine kinase/DNA-binding response OmpR family regulator